MLSQPSDSPADPAAVWHLGLVHAPLVRVIARRRSLRGMRTVSLAVAMASTRSACVTTSPERPAGRPFRVHGHLLTVPK